MSRYQSSLSGLRLDARHILLASLPSDFPDSFFAVSQPVNDNALSVTAPAASGVGGSTTKPKKSNLDRSGFSIVKRGVTVSCDGFHFRVLSVRLGQFVAGRVRGGLGMDLPVPLRGSCASVYVVRPF